MKFDYLTLFMGLLLTIIIHPIFIFLWIPPLISIYKAKKQKLSEESKLVLFRKEKKAYLSSDDWKKIKFQVLSRDNFTCQACGTTNTILHVHHIVYTNLYKEQLSDLVSLCETCHTKLHNFHGYPQTYNDYFEFYGPIVKD